MVKYKRRISGPLIDRIDLHIDVHPVEEEGLMINVQTQSSESIHTIIQRTQQIQKVRFKNTKVQYNGEMNLKEIKNYCHLSNDATLFLKNAINKLSLSARSYFKIIKIAQTISDLEQEQLIHVHHIAEALQFRLQNE